MYILIDTLTGHAVGKYATKQGARSARDRKDAEYGAARYRVDRLT